MVVLRPSRSLELKSLMQRFGGDENLFGFKSFIFICSRLQLDN